MTEAPSQQDSGQKTRFYVFCSDRSRNGKTLLGRLFCANLPVNEAGGVTIFDTDYPDGGLAHYYPQIGHLVDFSKTLGRVQLFDTVMAAPTRYIVADIQAEYFHEFFQTFHDVGLDQAAHEAGIHLVIYYVMDKGPSSVENGLKIRESLEFSQFYFLVNEAIGTKDLRSLEGDAQSVLSSTRILRFPELSRNLVALLEDKEFDLFAFMAGQTHDIEYETRLELWNLLEFLYQQRTPDSAGVTHFL